MQLALAAGLSDTVHDMDWVVGMMDFVAAKPKRRAHYNLAKATRGDPTNTSVALAMADARKPGD